MKAGNSVQWNVEISRETDNSLRSFLEAHGSASDDLSSFVEKAVLIQLFRRTIDEVHARNRNVDPGQIQAEADEAVREVRREMSGECGEYV